MLQQKPTLMGNWRVVYFDGTEVNGTDNTSIFKAFTHQKALAFAMETIKPGTGVKISDPDSDTFDKETAEKWLAIDKKKRKTLAKTKHPAKAIADEAAAATKKAAANAKKDGVRKGEDAPAALLEAEYPTATNEDEIAKSE